MMQYLDIREYGAKENVLCTSALQAAIDEADKVGGTVLIPKGEYITGTVNLRSASLHLGRGACLKGSRSIEDYTYIDYVHIEMGRVLPLLYSMDADGVRLSGEGLIDMNGDAFFNLDDPEVPESRVPFTPTQLSECTVTRNRRPNQPIFFLRCKYINVQDIRIINAPSWTMSFNESSDIRVTDVTIDNSMIIPNCDGMHFCCCQNVMVRGCNISAGDDCVAVTCATNWDIPCEKVTISDCVFRSGSKAISLGYMHSIVRDVVVSNCVVTGSNRALVIMSSHGTGLVENLVVTGLRLDTRVRAGNWWGNGEPICIMGTPHDNPSYQVRPAQGRFDVAVRNILFSGLCCTGENVIAIIGESGSVENVRIDGISFTLKDSDNLPLKGRMVDLSPGEQTALMPEDGIPYWLFVKQTRNVQVSGVLLQPYRGRSLQAFSLENEGFSLQVEGVH